MLRGREKITPFRAHRPANAAPPSLRAFTLIELLVVIAIVVVLVGILLPSLAASKRQARRVLCITNLRNLGSGAQNYIAEFSGAIPWEGYAEGDRPIRSAGRWDEPSAWFNSMPKYSGQKPYIDLFNDDAAGIRPMPHAGDRGAFVCPEAGPPAGSGPGDLVQGDYFMMFGIDSGNNSNRQKTYWSYGFNTQLDGGLENRNSPPTYHVTVNFKQIPLPSATVLLAEKIMRADELNPPYNSNVCQSIVSWREYTTRHAGGGFILFLDNHVDFFTRNQIYDTPYLSNMNHPGSIVWNPAGDAN